MMVEESLKNLSAAFHEPNGPGGTPTAGMVGLFYVPSLPIHRNNNATASL